jgi:prevent-host-death family protein
METVGATEARARLAELLRRVDTKGERIVIERRGKPRAVLVPLEDLKPSGASGREAR